VLLVEGPSHRAAVRTLAARLGGDHDADGVAVVALGGITNRGHFLDVLGPRGADIRLAKPYDEPEAVGTELGHGCRNEDAAGTERASRLGQGSASPAGIQVIERSKQQDRVGGAVLDVEPSCITQPRHDGHGGSLRCGVRLLHVPRNRIDQRHVVPVSSEHGGVATRSTADIQDTRRWRRGSRSVGGSVHRRPWKRTDASPCSSTARSRADGRWQRPEHHVRC
jgi:hypothetical protein